MSKIVNFQLTICKTLGFSRGLLFSAEIQKNVQGEFLTPDGQVSNFQDEKIYRLINSETFKNWYHGPVLENGEPQAFYHGTGEYFPKFDLDRAGSTRGFANLGAGAYLSFDKKFTYFYKGLAQEKIPQDQRGDYIEKLENDKYQFIKRNNDYYQDAEAYILNLYEARNKISNEVYGKKELLKSLLDVDEWEYGYGEKDVLDFIPSNITAKEKLRNYLNPKYKKIIALKNEILDINQRVDNCNQTIHEYEQSLLQKRKQDEEGEKVFNDMIRNLYPEGIIMTVFANVENILNLNNEVQHSKIIQINNALLKNSLNLIEVDKTWNGKELYSKLCEIIQGKPLVHHLSLTENEAQVDSRPVSRFLCEHKIYEAAVFENQFDSLSAPKGQKTLTVYDVNKILIV